MQMIIVYLSTAIPVPTIQQFLATLYRLAPDTIVMADATSDEVPLYHRIPRIQCDYQLTRGEFPVYLGVHVDSDLMPHLDETQCDYWFAQQACTAFDCYALIGLALSDPYVSFARWAWIWPGRPLYRVQLVDELATGPDPIIVIDRSAPIEPIDDTPYRYDGGSHSPR